MDDARSALGEAGDTIVAPASAPGAGALSIVRISGDEAFSVLASLEGVPNEELPLWGARRGRLDIGEDGLRVPARVFSMPAPRSYTGEHQVELHLPGGEGLLGLALDAACAAGARLAGPGEFTRRAYRNGKLDLAQAEAVAALVNAVSEGERRGALALLREGAGDETRGLIEGIVELLVPLELDLDFSDQDIDIVIPETLAASLEQLEARAAHLASEPPALARTSARPRVLLVGPPNAGKSSLFNALCGEERALVSDRAGTTRDYLEARIESGGIAFTLVDTAGRDFEGSGADEAAHALREREVARADLLLEVRDPRTGMELEAKAETVGRAVAIPVVRVWTHADRLDASARGPFSAPDAARLVSAVDGEGLRDLIADVAASLRAGRGTAASALADHARRRAEAFAEVHEALGRARSALEDDLGHELVAEDLQEARRILRRLTGETYDEAVLDRIMARFCIGK